MYITINDQTIRNINEISFRYFEPYVFINFNQTEIYLVRMDQVRLVNKKDNSDSISQPPSYYGITTLEEFVEFVNSNPLDGLTLNSGVITQFAIPEKTRDEADALKSGDPIVLAQTPLIRIPSKNIIVNFDNEVMDWHWPNAGQIKLNFEDFIFDLETNTPLDPTIPTPLTYSPITHWPENVHPDDRNDSSIIFNDPSYGQRLLENSINLQPHWWRIITRYTRGDSSTDEQLFCVLYNPVSGFKSQKSLSLLRGNVEGLITFDLKTYADINSIGYGYKLQFLSTTPVSVVVDSITRESVHKDYLKILE